MDITRLLLGGAATAAVVSLFATGPATAGNLDFLNHMNPEYTKCISNVRSQLAPQYKNDPKVSNAVITACNRAHPAFGKG